MQPAQPVELCSGLHLAGTAMSTESHRSLIEHFYAAFARRDGAAMAACYTPDAQFRDPVFDLRGERIGAMWRMLCERGENLRVAASGIETDTDGGRAHWQAWYTFRTTGRYVHNIIDAHFRFRAGRIAEHIDDFSFWRWSRQALGPVGLVLGWMPVVRAKVRREADAALNHWIATR